MAGRIRLFGWRAVLSMAASLCVGCGGSSSSGSPGPLFEDHFESYAEGSALMGATWSDPIYDSGDAWSVVKDPDHPDRDQVAKLTGYWSSAIAGDEGWTDYRISALVRPTGPYTGIVGRYSDGHFYVLVFHDSKVQLTRSVGTVPLAEADFAVSATTYYELSMELDGADIRCFVDDVLELSYTDPLSLGHGSAGVIGAGGLFDDVVVTAL